MSGAKKAAKAKSAHARKAQVAQDRQARRAAKALGARVSQVNRRLQHIRNLHRGDFPEAQRPTAAVAEVNERAIRAKHRKEALAGIALSKRAERSAAKERAKGPAEREIAAAHQRLAAERGQAQAQLDEKWARLGRNDPDVLLAVLREAFEGHEVPVALTGARADEVELAVLVPAASAIPDEVPATESGQTVLRRVTPAERAMFYRELACGHLLAAVRQAFAAAPGLASVRAVVLREAGVDVYGKPTLDCLLAARFTRLAFEGVRWSEVAAGRIVADTSTDLLTNTHGAANEIQPIALAAYPGLAALVQRVDFVGLSADAKRSRAGRTTRVAAGSASVRSSAQWPDLARVREVGFEWFGARSGGQRGVLIGVVVFLLLGVVGALADSDEGTTVDTGAPPRVTRETITTSTTDAIVQTTIRGPGVAEGVPAGGDDTSIVRVIDGDTFEVTGGTRIRLIGIDTPETVDPGSPVQCFGPEATRYANELLPPGTRVRLIYDVGRLDSFGRTLAYVYKLDDGLFVNRAIARNGFAQQATFAPNVAHAEEFRTAVAEARDANLGLWRACQSTTTATPVAPTTRATTPPVATAPPSTRSTVATATPCTATASPASPVSGGTVTVRVSSEYPSETAVATAHYKTTNTVREGTTNGSGTASMEFRTGTATPGYEVVVDVVVAGASRCRTSFTPH